MCGIVGAFASNLVSTEVEVFNQLLYTSALRGTDSTGVLSVRTHNKQSPRYAVLKEPIPPAAFLHRYETALKANERGWYTSILVGHCRAATMGSISKDNAHPFDLPNVVGVHNGTIYGLKREKEQTDSEVLLSIVSERGIDEAVKELDNTGAYALVWFDKNKHTLHALRNNARPLHWVKTTSQVVYIASELKMLEWVIGRASNLTVAGTYNVFEAHKLYTWELDGSLTPEIRECRAPVKTYYVPAESYSRGWGCWSDEDTDMFYRQDEYAAAQPTRPSRVSLPKDRSAEGLIAVWDEVVKEFGYISWKDPSWNKDVNSFAHLSSKADQKQTYLPPPRIPDVPKKDEEEPELYCTLDNEVLTEDEVWTLLGEGCSNCTRVPDLADCTDSANNLVIPIWKSDTGHHNYLCPTCSTLDSRHPHN